MSTRMKLLLCAVACILCMLIVWSTDTEKNKPFSNISTQHILSFDVETPLGFRTIEDPAVYADLAAHLQELQLLRFEDAQGTLGATIEIYTAAGHHYVLEVYDAHIVIDDTACAIDPAQSQALMAFALGL